MSDEKKEPHKKTEAEKKAEQNAMIHLWMNGMAPDSTEAQKPTDDQTETSES